MTAGMPRSASAVILAGGLGTRLRPVLGGKPKVLAEVAGRPFLAHLLAHLSRCGIHHVVLATGWRSEEVEAFVGDGSIWGLSVEISPEETPLGTGGAVRQSAALVRSDPFLVLNGDTFVAADPARLLDFHLAHSARASLLAARVGDRSRYGALRIDAEGRVLGFSEKGLVGEGYINAGVYALSRAALGLLPASGPCLLEIDLFPALLGGGLWALRVEAPFLDIGTPESLRAAEAFFA
jgi:NDP-sugar pyrophosphorylase family protein